MLTVVSVGGRVSEISLSTANIQNISIRTISYRLLRATQPSGLVEMWQKTFLFLFFSLKICRSGVHPLPAEILKGG